MFGKKATTVSMDCQCSNKQSRAVHSPEYLNMRDVYYESLKNPECMAVNNFLRAAEKQLDFVCITRLSRSYFYKYTIGQEGDGLPSSACVTITVSSIGQYDIDIFSYHDSNLLSVTTDKNSIAGLRMRRIINGTRKLLNAQDDEEAYINYKHIMDDWKVKRIEQMAAALRGRKR